MGLLINFAFKEQKLSSRMSFFKKIAHVALMVMLYLEFMSLYEELVAPIFYFGGFSFSPRGEQLLEWGLIIAAALLMPLRFDSPSRLFMWFSFLFILMPATVLSAQQSSDRGALLMMYAGTFLVRFLGYLPVFKKTNKEPVELYGFSSFSKLIVFFYVVIIASAWLLTGGVKTFDFSDVYDYRFDFNQSIVFPLNYLIPIVGGALSSLVVAYSLALKRYKLTALMMLLGFLLFSVTTHKLFLFYPFLVVFFYFLQLSPNGGRNVLITLIFLSMMGVMTKDYEVDLLGMVFANRAVFLPANIHFEYFKEFSSIGFQYWSESKFSFGLTESRLSMPSMNHIGEIMTGDSRVGANTGWMAIGYMNFGFIGITIYAMMLSFILSMLDSLANRINPVFVTSSVCVPILFLVTNGDLLITLLTGGLIFNLLILFIYSRSIPK